MSTVQERIVWSIGVSAVRKCRKERGWSVRRRWTGNRQADKATHGTIRVHIVSVHPVAPLLCILSLWRGPCALLLRADYRKTLYTSRPMLAFFCILPCPAQTAPLALFRWQAPLPPCLTSHGGHLLCDFEHNEVSSVIRQYLGWQSRPDMLHRQSPTCTSCRACGPTCGQQACSIPRRQAV